MKAFHLANFSMNFQTLLTEVSTASLNVATYLIHCSQTEVVDAKYQSNNLNMKGFCLFTFDWK